MFVRSEDKFVSMRLATMVRPCGEIKKNWQPKKSNLRVFFIHNLLELITSGRYQRKTIIAPYITFLSLLCLCFIFHCRHNSFSNLSLIPFLFVCLSHRPLAPTSATIFQILPQRPPPNVATATTELDHTLLYLLFFHLKGTFKYNLTPF